LATTHEEHAATEPQESQGRWLGECGIGCPNTECQTQGIAGNNEDEPDLSEANQDEPDPSEYRDETKMEEWRAKFGGVSRSTIRTWMNKGDLRALEGSKRGYWRFHNGDVEKIKARPSIASRIK